MLFLILNGKNVKNSQISLLRIAILGAKLPISHFCPPILGYLPATASFDCGYKKHFLNEIFPKILKILVDFSGGGLRQG
jgi:hypothetical protein